LENEFATDAYVSEESASSVFTLEKQAALKEMFEGNVGLKWV
jgi:hypothetical protein